jgi:ATP-dependent Clp protease ATP-binding subunit ClpA
MGLLDLKFVRDKVEQQIGAGIGEKVPDRIPYTPRVKRVLALAAKEARSLQHKYVGTEHILLGLLREGDGLAGRTLKELGLSVEITRQQVLRELDPNFSVAAGEDLIPQQEERKKPAREIDTSKRYDVYYRVGQQEVVYRNVLFKGIRTLFPRSEQDVFSQYMEIEQPDGRIVFVARSALTKFCEHGTEPDCEAGA